MTEFPPKATSDGAEVAIEGRDRDGLVASRIKSSAITKHGHSRRLLLRHSTLPLRERSGRAIASLGMWRLCRQIDQESRNALTEVHLA